MSKNCKIVKASFFKCEVIPVCPKCGHEEKKEVVENFVPVPMPEPIYQMQCTKCGYFYQYKS